MGGDSEYILVIPESTSTTVQTAATEFQYLFKEATGVELPIQTDAGLQHSTENTFISLGNTALLQTADISAKEELLTKDGVMLVTKDQTLFLIGGSDSGVLYSVYEYMELTFGFDTYSADCFVIETVNVEETAIPLGDFNYFDNPDFEIRHTTNGILFPHSYDASDYDGQNYANRMRLVDNNKTVLMPVTNTIGYDEEGNAISTSEWFHNTSTYLPYAIYGESNPDWFATVSETDTTVTGQLCFTAHGNTDEFTAMTKACAAVIEKMMKRYPTAKYPDYQAITLTIEDGYALCGCDACSNLEEQYGTDAGSVIIFMNEVNRLVREWEALSENAAYARGTDFKILFFAYNTAILPPVEYDESTNTYSVIDEEIALGEGVGVYFCPTRKITSYFSNVNADINATFRAAIEGWLAMTDELYCWSYNSNFLRFFYFHNTYDFYYNGGLSYLADHNVKSLYVQGDSAQTGGTTAWHSLQAYLNSKLEWNTTLNVDDLIDNYMNAMFLEAAPTMKALFKNMCSYTETMYAENGFCDISLNEGAKDYRVVNKAEYWDYATLKSWMAACDTALEVVAHYETSEPALYAKLKKRIEAEWLSPAFMMLDLYSGSIVETELSELLTRFETVTTTIGIEKTNENGGTVADFTTAKKALLTIE